MAGRIAWLTQGLTEGRTAAVGQLTSRSLALCVHQSLSVKYALRQRETFADETPDVETQASSSEAVQILEYLTRRFSHGARFVGASGPT